MKTMIKKYCLENGSDWDKELPYLLFAFRSAPSEALGYSPFQLVFGHSIRGPLDVVRECWEEEAPNIDLLTYITELGGKLSKAWEYARKQLEKYQVGMKSMYDKKVKARSFNVGEQVLVLLPLPGSPLKATFSGPWKVVKKVSEQNYLIETPTRRKKYQLCHINMLKPFVRREEKDEIAVEMVMNEVKLENNSDEISIEFPHANSEILNNLPEYLKHLDGEELQQIIDVILEFKELFKNDPGRTNVIEHDVDVGEANPIKQGPYRLNPSKNNIVNKEVDYMLEHDLIKASCSSWSSPVVLVPKERGQHGQYRLCFDYRKLNNVTKSDSYPMPRVDDCIDKVGNAKYINKFD